jgi:hypothetical protein
MADNAEILALLKDIDARLKSGGAPGSVSMMRSGGKKGGLLVQIPVLGSVVRRIPMIEQIPILGPMCCAPPQKGAEGGSPDQDPGGSEYHNTYSHWNDDPLACNVSGHE